MRASTGTLCVENGQEQPTCSFIVEAEQDSPSDRSEMRSSRARNRSIPEGQVLAGTIFFWFFLLDWLGYHFLFFGRFWSPVLDA